MPFPSVGYLIFCQQSRQSHVVLASLTGGGGTTLRAPVYNLLPIDLRAPPATTLASLLGSGDEPLLSPTLPTLLLFECVLAYMTPAASNALIQWFVDYFAAPGGGLLGSVVYEMFKLNDAFGRVMLSNLKVRLSLTLPFAACLNDLVTNARRQSRNVSLPGAESYPDLASLSRRFLNRGFTTAQALTLCEIRRRYIEPQELQRLSRLELLDEVEELELVLDHYAISWGIKFPESWSLERGDVWGLVPKDRMRNVHDGDDDRQ